MDTNSSKCTPRGDPPEAAVTFSAEVADGDNSRSNGGLELTMTPHVKEDKNALPFPKFFASMLLAFAGLFGHLTVPTAACASKAVTAPTTTSKTATAPPASSTKTLNPNLIQLSSTTREKLDAHFLKRVRECRGALVGIDAHINDPWEIEDVWLIVVWHFVISKGRRAVFDLLQHKRKRKETEEKAAVEEKVGQIRDTAEKWERSFLKWLKRPMQAVGALWVTLYIFDNAIRVGTLLEITRWLPDTTLNQFDRGMYTLTAGVISVMAADRWFPDFLKTKLVIQDASQRLVLTRLVTVALAMATAASSAVVFGLPPKSLLGFGGIGGLTFGLAAKDLVSNFIGGSMLAIVRPFSPGEKIYLMAVGGRFRGTNEPSVGGYLVQDIGWYQTTLIPKDTRPTTVPNGFFLGANVINITRQTARVLIMNIRVRFDDLNKVPEITREIERYLKNHAAVVQPPNRPIRVHLRDVQPDHGNIRVEAHSHITKKDLFLAANQEITLAVFEIVDRFSTGPAWPIGCYDGMKGSERYR